MKVFLLLSISLFFCRLSAQFTISGRFTNEEGQPIEYAKVSLKKLNDSLQMITTLTDKNGKFSLSAATGNYLLLVDYLGQNLLKKNLSIMNHTHLGTFKVNVVNSIGSVTVEGYKKAITLKADRLIFNPEIFAGADIGNAMDVLKVTPKVWVVDDNLSMFGKEALIVRVNNRKVRLSGEDLINYLKNIQADRIASVEIISNPPAQYSAEGNIGIVNIVLKKTPNNSWNASIGGYYTQGKYGLGGPRSSVNYQKNKLSIYAAASYSGGHYATQDYSLTDYPKVTWIDRSRGKSKLSNLSTQFGGDYQISKRWSLGGEYIGSYRHPEAKGVSMTTLIPDSGIVKSGTQSNQKPSLNTFNLHSKVILDTLGRSIEVNMDALDYHINQSSEYHSVTKSSSLSEVPDGEESLLNALDRDINNYIIKADVSHPFKKWKLSYGMRISFNKTDNNIKVFNMLDNPPNLDKKQSNAFKYKENTQAWYASASKSFGKRWQLQLGLRTEYTQLEGNSITLGEKNKDSYLEYFPTAYIAYTPSKKHNFNLQYSRRINRPSFGALNPFRSYSNPYYYLEGNPTLKPSFTTNIELTHVYKGALQTGLFYQHEKNLYSQVVKVDVQTYITGVTRLNFSNSYLLGLQQSYSFNRLKWWNSETGYYMGYLWLRSMIYPVTPKSSETFMAGLISNNSFIWNKKRTIISGINFSYTWPLKTGDFSNNRKRAILDIYFKMNVFEKKLQLKLSGNNLLKEYQFNNARRSNHIFVESKGYYDSRNITLSLSYRFGNKKVQVRKHESNNQEEKNRL